MFHNLYKKSINGSERQEIRRKQLLDQQKLKRLELQDELRHTNEVPLNDEEETNGHYKKYNRNYFKNIKLQLSEWFREKPEKLDDWILVPCPKGKRCLVVAKKGETKVYSKNYTCLMSFPSFLPGGGFNCSFNDCTILDCIYNKNVDTFYVLDVKKWRISMTHGEAEFRFFMLKSKLSELNDIKCQITEMKRFQALNYYDMSDEETLAMTLERYPLWTDNKPELDGFLFYHKQSHYICGPTPLVCWLYPFMLPDILQIPVSKFYDTPCNYSQQNPWQYMDEFDKKMDRKKKWRRSNRDESGEELEATNMEKD